MEILSLTKVDSELHVENFPEAVKVIKIDSSKSKQLADLSLHKIDMEFAADCLDAINQIPEVPLVVRQALWRSAIIHFIKCFGGNVARSSLKVKEIFKDDPTALNVFEYFKNLRNKHVIHDENSYTQSIPGAILNKRDKKYKIQKSVCFNAIAETLEQDNYNNLHLLIQTANDWVIREFDNLCKDITNDLETKSYDDLYGREAISYRVPKVDEIDKKRKKY